jgi:hypothetical protein
MKDLQALKRKGSKKRSETIPSESKARFSKNEYLLELAAANSHYLSFRNDQFPEIMDVSRWGNSYSYLHILSRSLQYGILYSSFIVTAWVEFPLLFFWMNWLCRT